MKGTFNELAEKCFLDGTADARLIAEYNRLQSARDEYQLRMAENNMEQDQKKKIERLNIIIQQCHGCCLPTKVDHPGSVPICKDEQIAEVLACDGSGGNDEEGYVGVFRTEADCYGYITAWQDYTGHG